VDVESNAPATASRPSSGPNDEHNDLNDLRIYALVEGILTHESPLVSGSPAEDVQRALEDLEICGDRIIKWVVSGIKRRAYGLSGHSGEPLGPCWWDGAIELCKVLGRLGTSQASSALMSILETDGMFIQFDQVREEAAKTLATFSDKGLVPRLAAACALPGAPVFAIREAIQALGGEPPSDHKEDSPLAH
jgi:hypothetical protein